jgi:hypothetical protein
MPTLELLWYETSDDQLRMPADPPEAGHHHDDNPRAAAHLWPMPWQWLPLGQWKQSGRLPGGKG